MRSIFNNCSMAALALLLVSCETTQPLPEPELDFVGAECMAKPDIASAIMIPDDAKSVKRMMKHRTIRLSSNLNADSPCLTMDEGSNSPFALFELPQNLKGPVIYAGAIIDPNSTFAANISILDDTGVEKRTFPREQFRFQGNQYGVQFRPKAGDAYLLITANPELIGNVRKTTEQSMGTMYISNGFGGGGTNYIGQQTAYNRTFSYDGLVNVRVVFPEQEEKEK